MQCKTRSFKQFGRKLCVKIKLCFGGCPNKMKYFLVGKNDVRSIEMQRSNTQITDRWHDDNDTRGNI